VTKPEEKAQMEQGQSEPTGGRDFDQSTSSGSPNLPGRYQKIGIPAVKAAVRFQGRNKRQI
jgi:hypothetical protein